MSLELFKPQIPVYHELINYLSTPNGKGLLFTAITGSGKTYPIAQALGVAQTRGYLTSPNYDNQVCEILYLTVKNAVTQTKRVLAQAGVFNVEVTTAINLQHSFGKLLLEWFATRIINGEPVLEPTWIEETKPSLIIVDEAQIVKNEDTTTAQIIRAAAKQGIKIIFISATPFSKFSETRTILTGLGIADDYNWSSITRQFCHHLDPTKPHPTVMKELRDYLRTRGKLIEMPGVRFKYPSKIYNRVIEFETNEQRDRYNRAYEDYLEKLRGQNRETPEGRLAIILALNEFKKIAEYIKTPVLAKQGYKISQEFGKQVIIGVNYKVSLEMVQAGLSKLGLDPKKISTIHGGRNNQRDIDKFQAGISDVCILTIKSGGAGLSLHHCIPKGRPRHCLLGVCWSPIDMLQLIGRGHRITSISETVLDIIWWKDTVEERIAERADDGVKSIKSFVYRAETWVDIFNKEVSTQQAIIQDSLKDDDGEEIEEDDIKQLMASINLDGINTDKQIDEILNNL